MIKRKLCCCAHSLGFSLIAIKPKLLACILILGLFTNFSSAAGETRRKADEILFGNMRSAGTEYKVDVTTTYRHIASGKNNAEREKPNYHPLVRPSIPVVYSTNYLDSFQSQPLYPVDGRNMSSLFSGLFGGYYLGQTMSPSHAYYKSYVPYREHFGNYYRTTKPSMVAPQKKVNPCLLDRWNRELPFTELPNMALKFLADDSVSGESTSQKAAFMFDLVKSGMEALVNYNDSGETFQIPTDADCHYNWIFFYYSPLLETFAPAKWIHGFKPPKLDLPEDPMISTVRNILYSYSSLSKKHDFLQDLVSAAKACLPRGDPILYPEILPCLDFSVSPDELLSLNESSSIFQSSEICQNQLNPDIIKCNTKKRSDIRCSIQQLVALNGFARSFYLCKNALEPSTFLRLKEYEREMDMVMSKEPTMDELVKTKPFQDLFQKYKTNADDLPRRTVRPRPKSEQTYWTESPRYDKYKPMYEDTYAITKSPNDSRHMSSSTLKGLLAGGIVGFFVLLVIIVWVARSCKDTSTTTQRAENQPLNDPSVGIQGFHPELVSGYHPQPIVTGAVHAPLETTGFHPAPSASPHVVRPHQPSAPAELDALPPSYDSVYAVGDFSSRMPKYAN